MPTRDLDIDAEAKAAELESQSAQEILEWALGTFHPRMYFACSFQKTSSVIAHMASQIQPDARFFYLDTDVLFDETYETRDRLADFLGIHFDRYSNLTIPEQARLYGDELWNRDPDACCGIRKVSPLNQALSEVDAWVAGVRRDQSPTRAHTEKIHWDEKHGLWKFNPLADWSERDVWDYLARHDIPYHPLHDRGYASIGCTHCTTPGDGRDGRWAGHDKTDCGMHS